MIAPVGQAVMQRVQLPQDFASGVSGAKRPLVTNSASSTHEPKPGSSRFGIFAEPADARTGCVARSASGP